MNILHEFEFCDRIRRKRIIYVINIFIRFFEGISVRAVCDNELLMNQRKVF